MRSFRSLLRTCERALRRSRKKEEGGLRVERASVLPILTTDPQVDIVVPGDGTTISTPPDEPPVPVAKPLDGGPQMAEHGATQGDILDLGLVDDPDLFLFSRGGPEKIVFAGGSEKKGNASLGTIIKKNNDTQKFAVFSSKCQERRRHRNDNNSGNDSMFDSCDELWFWKWDFFWHFSVKYEICYVKLSNFVSLITFLILWVRRRYYPR